MILCFCTSRGPREGGKGRTRLPLVCCVRVHIHCKKWLVRCQPVQPKKGRCLGQNPKRVVGMCCKNHRSQEREQGQQKGERAGVADCSPTAQPASEAGQHPVSSRASAGGSSRGDAPPLTLHGQGAPSQIPVLRASCSLSPPERGLGFPLVSCSGSQSLESRCQVIAEGS